MRKQLLWCLVMMGLTASTASMAAAGPNAGGVLWVHDTGLVLSSDPETNWPPPPADCAEVDNEVPLAPVPLPPAPPLSQNRIWKVYAAFPPGSNPRLLGAAWGIQFPENTASAYSYVNTVGGMTPNEGGSPDFVISSAGFPTESGSELGHSFGDVRLTTVVTCYVFWGFGYNYDVGVYPNPTWCVAPHSNPLNRYFVDDATPRNYDPIMGYGCLGFGVPGTTPCPNGAPDAACCSPEGTCAITAQADCAAPNVWRPEEYACDPNPCPPPTGACCYADGSCRTAPCDYPIPGNPCPNGMTEHRCQVGGGTYLGDFVPCSPNPCEAAAACCLPSGICLLRTQVGCAAFDPPGIWHPEWISCIPDPCGAPGPGACCTPTGSCTLTMEGDCAAPDVWFSDGTPCTPNPCLVPAPGACCAPTGACTVTMEGDCPAPSVWHRTWPTCNPGPCLAPGDGSIVGWGDEVIVEPSALLGLVAIAGGSLHSLGVKSDGKIVACGNNDYGQCVVPAPNAGFLAASGGGYHSLGLRSDGTIAAWGANYEGQCDVPAPNADFVAVASGAVHNLGLKSNGTIVAWGRNDVGQCNVPEPNAGFVAVAAGDDFSLGLKSDGTIVAWGTNGDGECDVPAPNAGFVTVAAGGYHSLGLRSDGTIAAWGANHDGQSTVPAPNAGFVAIAAGSDHSLGLKSDGAIVSWGSNAYGQCGVPEPNAGFVGVAGSGWHSLGLKSDGTLVAWGRNDDGECNVPAPNAGLMTVAGGLDHGLGLRSDGTIVAWGQNQYGQCDVPAPNAGFAAVAAGLFHSLGLKSDGTIVAWGYDGSGQCDVPAPNGGFVVVAAGDYHSLGLKSDGTIVAWGDNGAGQCNVPAPNADFVAVAGGGHHSLGLKSSGMVMAWGANDVGQRHVPAPNSGFVAVAAGWSHSLGLKFDGSIVAWGGNGEGQCDVPAPNTGFASMAGGFQNSLGLKSDGTIVAWGNNDFGQCNVPAPNAGFVAVAEGLDRSLALKSAGPTPGACCTPAGTCTLTLHTDCQSPDVWQGADTPCTPDPCTPVPVLLESWATLSLAEGLQIRLEMPLGTTGALYRVWRDPAAGPHDLAPTPDAVLVSQAWISSSAEGIIEVTDAGAPRGAAVRYFLEMSANGARGEFVGSVEARWDPPALAWSVGPTPFRGAVRLTPPGAGPARAEIFDPAGRLVRTLARSAGSVPMKWDGRNDDGHEAPTGIYLVRLTSTSGGAVERLVKIE